MAVERNQVEEFAMLARQGGYLGSDRRVSPHERTRWRFTFRDLVKDSLDALPGEEVDQAAAAVATLWSRLRDVYGVDGLLERAVPQLVAWESAYGWTRHGAGWVAKHETSSAQVLGRLLVAPESWSVAAVRYLDVLDQTTGRGRR